MILIILIKIIHKFKITNNKNLCKFTHSSIYKMNRTLHINKTNNLIRSLHNNMKLIFMNQQITLHRQNVMNIFSSKVKIFKLKILSMISSYKL